MEVSRKHMEGVNITDIRTIAILIYLFIYLICSRAHTTHVQILDKTTLVENRLILDHQKRTEQSVDQIAPIFSAHVCCGQTARWIKKPGHIVLDGKPARSVKRGTSPRFLAIVCRGQTVGWIKIPLGTKVCLSPGTLC